ncbi:alpha/beta fold hydrolase [Nibribacter ruber]|uniref:Alpha/beta fold hydrolase n=1 Tax=Nibribacter ruber TaxID=2698458 RepID=A0A6P1P0S7_9BACT|nr:alpha/beta hydrolase [Nibribacter ruber]QHL88018.1 alpha/beta fold hydrolase [Nibribacter ruber]
MKPLLLLHGALGAQNQFEPLLSLLPEQVPVYSFNLAGHGGAPFSEAPFQMETFVTQLLQWLEEKNLPPMNVFGYSMGGYVALEAARQQPRWFHQIFTLASKFAWSPEAAQHETAKLQPEVVQEKVPQFAEALRQRHAPQDWQELMRRTAAMMQQLGAQPLLTPETLAQITVPVRIAVGDHDPMVTIEETVQAYRQLPNAQLQIIPATKHPLEQLHWPLLAQALTHFFAYA